MVERNSDIAAQKDALLDKARTFIQYACSEYYTASLPEKAAHDQQREVSWRVYYSFDMDFAAIERHYKNAVRINFDMTPGVLRALSEQKTHLKWLFFRTVDTDYLTIIERTPRGPTAFIKPVPHELSSFLAKLAKDQYVFIDARKILPTQSKAKIYPFRQR